MGCLGSTGPYLEEDILSLKELHAANDEGQQFEPLVQSKPEPAVPTHPPPVEQRKPAEKKLVKPKWLKMWFQFLLDPVIIVQKRTFTFLVGQRYILIQAFREFVDSVSKHWISFLVNASVLCVSNFNVTLYL